MIEIPSQQASVGGEDLSMAPPVSRIIIQIPCHHVLANQNYLKLKKGAPLKQFFIINLGIGIIKKPTFFLFVFWTYLPVFYSNFVGRARWMQN